MNAYLELVTRASSKFQTAGGMQWLRLMLNPEQDNLHAAFEWASNRDLDVCFRLAFGMVTGWRAQPLGSPIRRFLPEALQRDATNIVHVSPSARAYALWALGSVCIFQGDNVTAKTFFEESVAILRQIDDKQNLARALAMSAPAYGQTGDISTSRAVLQEAMMLYQQLGDKWGLMIGSASIALGLFFARDYDAAQISAEQSLALCHEAGDRWAMINPLLVLGQIAVLNGDIETGREHLEEGLAICREIPVPGLTARVMTALGNLARQQKDFVTAMTLYLEVLDIWKKGGNRGAVALIQQIIGYMAVALGDYATARSRFDESLNLRQRLDNPMEIGGPLEGLASLAAAIGDDQRSARLLGAADAIRGEKGRLLESYDQPEVDQTIGWLRTQLPDQDFEALWAEGCAMSMEQAVAFALEK